MATEVPVPDIGDADDVLVVEVLVSAGDTVAVDDSLVTLESDKASMEIPSPAAGEVIEVKVAEGDSVREGSVILLLEESSDDPKPDDAKPDDAKPDDAKPDDAKPDDGTEDAETETTDEDEDEPKKTSTSDDDFAEADTVDESVDEGESETAEASQVPTDEAVDRAHASPGTRKLARELGVALGAIEGSGRKGRITGDDLRAHVRRSLERGGSGGGAVSGFAWPEMPALDFSKYGEIEEKPLSRIRQLSARNLHRSWLHVPHVTQHEDADVTELDAFRDRSKEEAKARGVKLTPLAFLMKAAAATLREFPDFNSSLHPDGDRLILKKFIHIGVAVDTDDGLIVPVIRDVDQKGVEQLAREVVEVAERARDKKLRPNDLQGATFSISSLGGIGGTGFTPIVNAPEVAILGASRTTVKPVWTGEQFEPRRILPLSLSYDHRVIDGASAARFVVHLSKVLSDPMRMIL